MDGGAWWAAVHGVTELNMTERLQFTSLVYIHSGSGMFPLFFPSSSGFGVFIIKLKMALELSPIKNLQLENIAWLLSSGWSCFSFNMILFIIFGCAESSPPPRLSLVAESGATS